MATYYLKPAKDTMVGELDPARKPCLRIQQGDTVEFETLEADWRIGRISEPKMSSGPFFKERNKEKDYGQALMGPVYIEGATPGKALAVQIGDLVPGNWGWSCTGIGDPDNLQRLHAEDGEYFQIWDIDSKRGVATSEAGHKVVVRPFMGIYAVAPEGDEAKTTYQPGPYGGNMDCKALGTGTTLYLPIFHEGALFMVGDGHAAQGDGEGGCTAIECPFDKVQLTFNVVDMELTSPIAKTTEGWQTFGYARSLTDATYMAFNNMAHLMMNLYGFEWKEALNLAGITVDLRVTQMVNGVRGVHAVLPKGRLIV